MKIKNLMLKNFAKVSEISVSFSDTVTYLVGVNGAGKTTVGLNGVWFVLKGLAQKGDGVIAERFRFIGPHGKSATADMTIHDATENIDIKIGRKLLKNSTELKIEASDGRQLDQKWLDSIFNSFLIDPMGFSRLSGKAQALAFGADTATFDDKKKALEVERRDIGRDVKRLQGVVGSAGNPEKVEGVDVAGLMSELTKRQDLNNSYEAARISLNDMDERVAIRERRIEELEAELVLEKEHLEKISRGRHELANRINVMEKADEQEIKDQIENADKTNKKAADYLEFTNNQSALKDEKACYAGKTSSIQKTEAARTKYLQSLNLPWPNITITDDGEFRLNEKPFKEPYFSTGEILKLGARIGSKLEDGLKYVYFPCSNNLDDANREMTFATLVKEGFQVVAEYVGTERKKDAVSILLREMKVVEDNEGDDLSLL